MDIYIYYRVRSDLAQKLHTMAGMMQTNLSRQHEVIAQLKRRPEEQDGYHTWMEIYLQVPAGFEPILKQAVADAGLAGLIDGDRHAEYFLDASSCA